jgi:hypothetical protein
MNDQLQIFSPTTSPAGASVISSLESAAGLLRCASPDGRKTSRSGRDRVPASRSPTRAKARVSTIQGTCGQTSFVSSVPPGPLSSWESRLRDRLAMVGSTECALIWREKVTPAGASISRLAPWTPPTSVPVSTGSPWPTALATTNARSLEKAQAEIDFGTQVRVQDHMVAATWLTPCGLDRPRTDETLEKSAAYRLRNAGQKTTPLYLGEAMQRRSGVWPTPTANSGGSETSNPPGNNQSINRTLELVYGPDRGMTPESRAAAHWPTPTAQDLAGGRSNPPGTSATGARPDGTKATVGLPATMRRPSGRKPTGSSATTESRGAPNPAFPCWLMGYGVAWLLATPSVKQDRIWVQTRI